MISLSHDFVVRWFRTMSCSSLQSRTHPGTRTRAFVSHNHNLLMVVELVVELMVELTVVKLVVKLVVNNNWRWLVDGGGIDGGGADGGGADGE